MSEEKKKILVVEDDLPLRKVLAEKLTDEGFSVVEAQDGEEGLAAAQEHHPHLILLDILMPKMDGITMLTELRRSGDSWGKHVPVIVLTNSTDAETIYRVTDIGSSDFLVKSEWGLDELVNNIKDKINA